jgi:Ca-activated chloride channel family protein
MSFANPEYLLLLIVVGLVAFFAYRKGPRKRSRLFIPTADWVDQRPRFRIPSPFRVHYFLRLPALILIVIGLARPQDVFERERRTIEAVDMVISFDLSKSMDAVDFKPDRRTVAINILTNFIDQRPDDRIGLVLFSGEAFLAVPVTSDHKMVKNALIQSSNRHLQDGTAIGESIAVAVAHLKDSKAKSRIVILVTDGDNNMGSVDPETAAELAKGFGIKVYTIAVGRKGKVDFPVKIYDPVFGEQVVWQQLTDAINEPLLQSIASRTQGRFFRAQDIGVLEKIFETIDSLEKTKVEVDTFVRTSEKAWPYLLIALILVLTELFALNTRWRKLP